MHGVGDCGHLGDWVGSFQSGERGVFRLGITGRRARIQRCAQTACGSRGRGASVALVQRDAFATLVGLGEFVDALAVGVAVEDLYHGRGIGGHGDGVAGQQVRQMLGGARVHLVVVHEHVGSLHIGQSVGACEQEAHGHCRRFRFQDAAGEVQHVLQQGVHVGLLAGDEPAIVVLGVTGQLRPIAVEELEHLAQPPLLQAARFHVLHDEAEL